MPRLAAVAACLLLPAALHAGADPTTAADDYARLQKWRFSSQGQSVVQPVTIGRDTATWTLTSGTVRLMEPTSDGRVTGLVFEGQGTFRMTVPDPVELAQLRRFSDRKELTALEQPFTQLVLRASDDTIVKAFPTPNASGYGPLPLAEKRHNAWLIDQRIDVDARVLAAILNPGALQLTADMKTVDFDWLTYDYDSSRREEITVTRVQRLYPEVWISLDRAEDRRQDGRPGERESGVAKLVAIDAKVDLTKYGRTGEVGRSRQRTLNGRYVVEETIAPLVSGTRALPLAIASTVQEISVFDEQGKPVVALRDHIGARSASVDNKVWNHSLTLLLAEPLQAGTPRRFRFEYEFETANYAPGGAWYPTSPEGLEPHTGRLELTVNKRHEVRAMGKLVSESESDKGKTSIWAVERPAMMLTFSTAERFEEQKIDVAGIPQVVAFGPDAMRQSDAKMRNVAADVANALQFFQSLLDDKVDGERFYVTSIAAGHGQAFDGFLHLSDATFATDSAGASELFRAHEVAHEWFGHKVAWKTYRDQWLSEAFAEYAAMMFVESTVKGGPKFLEEMLDSYEGIIQGNMSGGFSRFNRPWLIELNPAYRARLGPIGVGYRASTGDMPQGYLVQTYYKGPMVLHMLRMLLRYKTHNDDLFVKILRDYVHEFAGKQAGTDDFRRIVERDAPGDWGYFFDAWVYGAAIPTYRWSWRAEPDPKGFKLSVTVKRSGVADDFTMPIPVRVDFEGGKMATFFVMARQAEQTVTQTLPAKPRDVTLAPGHSVLATFRRE